MSKKIEIGDAVMTDSLDGTPRIRFADGTSALLFDGYTCYFDVAGNKAQSLSLDQQAHFAKQAGKFPEFIADTIEGRANQQVAYDGYLADLGKSNFPGGQPPKSQNIADAYQGYLDHLNNGWRR